MATAAERDEQLVRGLGATGFVARGRDLADAVRRIVPGGVDAMIDAAVLGAPAFEALRGGGTFVSVHAQRSPVPLRGTTVVTVLVRGNDPRLAELVALVDRGALTLRVAGTYPLEQVAEAHRRMAAGGLRGRLVLTP